MVILLQNTYSTPLCHLCQLPFVGGLRLESEVGGWLERGNEQRVAVLGFRPIEQMPSGRELPCRAGRYHTCKAARAVGVKRLIVAQDRPLVEAARGDARAICGRCWIADQKTTTRAVPDDRLGHSHDGRPCQHEGGITSQRGERAAPAGHGTKRKLVAVDGLPLAVGLVKGHGVDFALVCEPQIGSFVRVSAATV